MDLKIHWKYIMLIILCKEVYLLPNTIVDDLSVYSCEGDWKQYDQHCFKLVKINLSWRHASSKCKSMGGNLASIHSKEQNDFLDDFSKGTNGDFCWIGLLDQDVDGMYAWDDETDVDYTNWRTNEPDDRNFSTGNCVAMSFYDSLLFPLGNWIIGRCDTELYFLCQKKIAASAITSIDIETTTFLTTRTDLDDTIVYMIPNTTVDDVSEKDLSSCEAGWAYHDHYCFKFLDNELDWRNSSLKCKSMGGHLASIHSKEQNDFVVTLSIGKMMVFSWIGLHDHALDGIFEWDDGTDVDYTHWMQGEPNGDFSHGDCVLMSLTHSPHFIFGHWFVYNCNSLDYYLCQKKSTSLNKSMDLDGTTITPSPITRTDIDRKTITPSTIARTDNNRENMATSAITSTDQDIKTIETSAIISTDMDIETITPSAIARTDSNRKNSLISVTAYVITIIMVIVFTTVIGGIFYYKRHWLEEKRSKVSKVFFRRADRVTDPSTVFIIDPKETI